MDQIGVYKNTMYSSDTDKTLNYYGSENWQVERILIFISSLWSQKTYYKEVCRKKKLCYLWHTEYKTNVDQYVDY